MGSNRLTLTAAGDALITRRISHTDDERFDELVESIRSCDAALVNLEVMIHDYEGYPTAQGPFHTRAPPLVADELVWAGFELFAAATNHTIDYGQTGMEVTMDHLDDRDLSYAGLGRNLAEARAPTYLDTPNGRVAVVAACSTITTGSEAGRQRPDLQGRPGLSPLRLDTRYVVPEHAMESLRELSEKLGLEALKEWKSKLGFPVSTDEIFRLVNVGGDTHPGIEVGDEFEVYRKPNETDIREIFDQLRVASKQADVVVASLHAHEGEGARATDQSIPAFLETFARGCIDAGADAFVGHGPHALRGIEIYEGAPIFYSLGNFISQIETISRLPAEIYHRYGLPQDAAPAEVFDEMNYDADGDPAGFLSESMFWESVLPVCAFGPDGVDRLELHPLDLQRERPRSSRGVPRLADADRGSAILAELQSLSTPYGTEIDIENGFGTVPVK